MARPTSDQPTEVELQILTVLWENGPSTVRQIHNQLTKTKKTNYSTTVKMLSIMLEKGLVKRDDSIRPQVYRASQSRSVSQKKMVKTWIQKIYEGSAKSLVMQALSTGNASKDDLEEIRQLIEKLEKSRD